jgi:hypothetical protein
LVSDTTP